MKNIIRERESCFTQTHNGGERERENMRGIPFNLLSEKKEEEEEEENASESSRLGMRSYIVPAGRPQMVVVILYSEHLREREVYA